MSSTGAGYDLSVTTFSPDGRVFQVEYASKAVEKSGVALGVRCTDGVVLGVEKVRPRAFFPHAPHRFSNPLPSQLLPSKMLLRTSNRRIHTVDKHAGLALAGLAADARQIVQTARGEAANYRSSYGDPAPGKVLGARVSQFVHAYTLYWYVRPFGCAVLLASFDEQNGPELRQVDPSGVSHKYYAAAIGKHMRGAKSELEKLDFATITCREAVKRIAAIIVKLHDDVKDKDYEIELSWVCEESERRHVRIPADLKEEAEREAREAKRKEEMLSDSDDDDDE